MSEIKAIINNNTTTVDEQTPESDASTIFELYELLDRFEILYPHIKEIADLRRAVVDKDMSSIFRLAGENFNELRKAVMEENLHSLFRVLMDKNCYEADELYDHLENVRKAVVNKNLRNIFRLIGQEDLRKLVVDNNIWKLNPVLEKYINTNFLNAFKTIFIEKLDIDKDCFSRGQLESKVWLVKELEKLDVDLGTVFLCAGWYATLATMLFESGIKINKIRSFDIDETTVNIAEIFNKPWFVDGWKFKALAEDINNIDYNSHTWQCWSNANNRMSNPISDTPDTIINTSCEHIENFEEWYAKIPKGKLVILQTNNYFEINEHVNCSHSLKDFTSRTPMSECIYSGELNLDKYTRYMRIGFI